jgi:hypothetical protein
MRKLTIKLRHKDIHAITVDDLDVLREFIIGERPIPVSFVNFLSEYQGTTVKEYIFSDQRGATWIIGFFLKYPEMLELTREFADSNVDNNYIPFASDAAGWHFCISLSEKSYNAIFVNRWTDHKQEEAFLQIADSFEEFVKGLQEEH